MFHQKKNFHTKASSGHVECSFDKTAGIFLRRVGKKPAQSPKILKRKQKKTNGKILDPKSFTYRQKPVLKTLSKKLIEEAEKS